MKYSIYINIVGNIAAHSPEVAPQRHHLFFSHFDSKNPTQRCATFHKHQSFTDGPIASGATRPEDSTHDWAIIDYKLICEVELPGNAWETNLHEAALRQIAARFDTGREVAAPSIQIRNVLTPMWDHMDRITGRAPLPKVKLLARTTKKPKYDFQHW